MYVVDAGILLFRILNSLLMIGLLRVRKLTGGLTL